MSVGESLLVIEIVLRLAEVLLGHLGWLSVVAALLKLLAVA
jgi:hypothetical protein